MKTMEDMATLIQACANHNLILNLMPVDCKVLVETHKEQTKEMVILKQQRRQLIAELEYHHKDIIHTMEFPTTCKTCILINQIKATM